MFQNPNHLSLALLASLLISGCQVDTATEGALNKLRANLQSADSGYSRDDHDDCDHDRDHDDDHDEHDGDTLIPVPLPSGAPGIGSSCYIDRFQQPTQNISRSVDILFVADTSGSMGDNRRKVADGIFSLIEELPADADYRIGVMLAHGSTSPNSGLLWRLPQSQGSVPGNPYVLDSEQLNANNLRGRLRALMSAARDHNQEQGEMGLYSFMKSLKSSKFAENQARGFYRPEAVLAVVFISDENDICAVYPNSANGMSGMTSAEAQIRARDCAAGITAASAIDAARAAKGSQSVTFGSIIHQEQEDEDDHEAFGWGYHQVAQLSSGV